MLTNLLDQKVTVHFTNGANVSGGVLEQADDKFVAYRTDYELFYIPITSIQSVSIDNVKRQRSTIGFSR
ncbi:hypothetical protein PASE110613_04795 [Paenibacillus sediminis]|uniref:DUF2642 domain-containing protein n=1 Tax=Paenibacillus sediminis TaxID=664909 RepID=A0ABS4H0N8_9BACL|nr:hypothetical protein [Paenibacillus sediminis]MBP1936090.1 hypothetical protein [Paenibacillus sediminis]